MPDVKLLKYSSEKEKAHTHDPYASCVTNHMKRITMDSSHPSHQTPPSGEVDGFHLVYSNRRRSCALVNTPSPCVNKAIHHIQEIERKIEVWFEQLDVALLESSEHLDIDESTLRSCTNSFDPGTICIEGKGISGKECDKVASLREEAKAVLLEIIDLIVRLETDRQEAEEALKKERERKIKLVQKIDFLSLWRLQHLPAAVQKEHEACARDINELLWHLQRKKERLKEIKERLQQAEIQNRRLLEDIGFVEKHAPLVKEKLACESNILHEIEKAQDEANEIFSKCSNELQSVQQLFDETESKANAERDKMSMELNDITSNLNAQIHELDQFELYSRACLKKMAEIQRNLIERENEDRFLKIQISNQSECEQILKDEITHLQSKTQNQEKQNKQLTDENTRLQDELQNIISSGEREVADLEKIYEVKRWKLINLQEKNREITLEIEDFAFKIQESEQRSELLEKETRRMKKSIIQNQDQENRVKEELDQVAMFHSASKAKLEDLRKQIATEETAMRRQEENTTRQILHEIKTSASLKAEIHSLKEKLEMEKRNVEKERAEIDKTSKEAMMEAIQIKKIVEECQRINRERAEKSTLLKNAIQELLKKHQSTEEFLGEKKKKLQSAMKELEEKHNKVAKELNVILERIKDLKQKTKDYQDSAKAMEKLEKNMQDSIPVLQTDCNTAEFKYQQAVNLIKDLQSEITNSNQRMKLTDETHNTLLKNRQKTLEKIKIALQDGLKENVQLAKDYETLQKSLLETKTQVLKCYDEKVRMESSLYDYQKLSLLQKRMHKALVEYFKQRGLYNQAGLAKFQAAFHQNSQKIVAVQEDLSKAILRISAFLYSLTDGSTATEDAAANKQPGMDAALQQKTEPTVQITV